MEILKYCLDLVSERFDDDTVLCNMTSKSLNMHNLDKASDQDIKDLFEDAHSFASSFSVMKPVLK
jgi:hypothetical protein